MATGEGEVSPLIVDPELLERYGNQLLMATNDLPDAPPPFVVTGDDAISAAIAQKLPMMEGGFQEALPQLKSQASSTATKVIEAAGQYASTDAQLAANYERHQFDSARGPGGSGPGSGADSMSQLGQMMSMPMQMASQAAQMPMQAMSAVAQVPRGIMQGAQQIGQMTGGTGGSGGASAPQEQMRVDEGVGQPDDDGTQPDARPGAAPGDANAERAPEPSPKDGQTITAVPQQSSPRHAAPDPDVNL